MRLENSKDKKSPLDDFKGLFVHKKSTESVPLFQVEYGLSLILTLLSCFEWFQNFCYHNFRLTSLRTHLITEESSIELGEGTCYTNIQLFFT